MEAPGHRENFTVGHSVARSDLVPENDDLLQLIDVWPRLSENVRAAILLLASASTPHLSRA